ncbi:MAG: methionyl-tRNA formyltransferase [Candidatus Dormibacteria bacterium]
MTVHSDYLDRIRGELWARDVFTFIPDRDLPPPSGGVAVDDGPRVAFAGFPSDYSLGFLLALLQLDVRPCGIITSPGAHPAILGDNALSRIADHLDVPLLRAWRVNDEHSRLWLGDIDADAIVMASFDQIVGGRALAIPRHGWLNAHPSLIPRYRGPEPVYWAIAEGAAETGITLHRAAPKVDSGPILAKASVAIEPTDNAGTLTKRLVQKGVELLPTALNALLHDIAGVPPDMSLSTYRTSVGHRSLQTAATAVEAERMVRAGFPNMRAWALIDGRPEYVCAARVVRRREDARGHTLTFADSVLELSEVCPTCGCHHDIADCPHREAAVATL